MWKTLGVNKNVGRKTYIGRDRMRLTGNEEAV